MKRINKIILSLIVLIIIILVGAHQWHYKQPTDLLREISSGEDIINAKNNDKIKEGIDNLNISTAYSDKRLAIEFLDFCYAINDIKSIQSQEFTDFAGLQELIKYLQDNNIVEPRDCMNGDSLDINGLKDECLFNEDNGLQNPYIALYALKKISVERFNKSMQVLSDFYKSIYPANSYLLTALYDKNTGVFTDKSYCDAVVKNNYEDFIRVKEGNFHIYPDELLESPETENPTNVNE